MSSKMVTVNDPNDISNRFKNINKWLLSTYYRIENSEKIVKIAQVEERIVLGASEW